MSASVNFYIATVHLASSIKQTIVAMLGVTFGISMYVFMTGFMTGVNNIQTELAFSALAHIRVYNDGPADKTNIAKRVYPNDVINLRNAKVIRYTDGIKNSAAILSLLQSQPNVSGVTTQVNINVFFKNAGNKINGTISGVDVINENKVFNISKYVVQGNWNELKQRSDGIFVGYELAKNLSLKINDNLNVLTSDGISRNYKVIGIYQTGILGADKSKAYITINAARQLLAFNQDYVTDIQINVRDFNQTQPLVDKLAPVISYRVESWQMSNHQLEAASGLRDIIAIAVSFTILIVAGFGIYNIMSMTINQKIKEIAILKAMGFSGQDVTVIFLTQSIVIGIIGGFVGMGLGFVISKLVSRVPFEVAGLHTLPMAFTPTDYVLAFIFSLMTTFIAGYLPARKASQVDPVIIIRG